MKGLRIKTYLKANMLVEHMTALSQKHTTVNYTQNYQWSEQNVFFFVPATWAPIPTDKSCLCQGKIGTRQV